ncbi:phosphoribosyl-ATP diphosphatase [Flavobacteriaceae bacterium Ap0902]|nr:phosphoribosyl-ATP diphosphatase [Flavobacteriaceae bacterium Ap0902]
MEDQEPKKELKSFPFLKKLERKMDEAKKINAKDSRLKRKFKSGPSQIAKKMGEEAVEMVIASEKDDDSEFLEEAADVLYYYLLSLHDRGYKLRDVLLILKSRHKKRKSKK